MLKLVTRGAILASALAMTACATAPGAYNGLSRDPMAMMVVSKNPDYGDMTASDYANVNRQANACKEFADQQMASVVETVGTTVATNTVAGAGLGPAAKAGFGDAARIKDYTPYGMVANAANAVPYGMQLQSGAKVAVIASCTNGHLQDPITRRKAPGVHAWPSYVRTNNRSGSPPSWVKPADPARSVPVDPVDEEDSFTAPAPPPPR